MSRKRKRLSEEMPVFRENEEWPDSAPNSCILPVDVMVKCHSSREITVHWSVKALDSRQNSDYLSLGFHIVVEDCETKKNVADVYTYQYAVAHYKVPAYLEPGRNYRILVTVRSFSPQPTDIAYGSVLHTAVLTQNELFVLLTKAIMHINQEGNVMKSIKWMYRNKPLSYFENIMSKRGGLMEIYSKDLNGDPGSPINAQISGLFFNVWVHPKSGKLPPKSPFGDYRLVIPISKFITEDFNLYFADFYCLSASLHYVTVVVTKQGSATDVFCQKNLIPLCLYTKNPFLYFNTVTGKFSTATAVRVEILYTENINVLEELSSGEASFYRVSAIFAGRSKYLGKPKNDSCQICNLHICRE